MKKCGKCKNEKPLDTFSKCKSTKDGYQKACKKCRKLEQAKYYANNKELVKERARKSKKERRKKWNDFKSTLKCSICGEDFGHCIEFHHLDPNKKEFTLCEQRDSLSWDKLMKEVKKCAILCGNCHTKVHYGVIKINTME